jgi:hypothetical protein
MYDLDVEGTLARFNIIDGTLLVSNPCLELWFLLHYRDQKANISTANCLRVFHEICPNYTKGKRPDNLKSVLTEAIELPTNRAEQLNRYENPSTSVSYFISEHERVKESKNES